MLLNRHNLEIPLLFVSNDHNRKPLTDIHVTPNYTEAADGHRWVRVTLPVGMTDADFPVVEGVGETEPIDHPFLLASDEAAGILAVLKRVLKSMKTHPILHNIFACKSGNGVKLVVTDLTAPTVLTHKLYQEDYPDVDKSVLSKMEPGPIVEIGINVDYLLDMCKALMGFTDKYTREVVLRMVNQKTFIGSDWQVLPVFCFEAKNSDTGQICTGVIMPRRLDKPVAQAVKRIIPEVDES